MAKGKGAAGSATITNRPAYARVSFLFQAAALLAGTQHAEPATASPLTSSVPPSAAATETETSNESSNVTKASPLQASPLQGMARRLLAQMRSVSRKTNMRVRPAVKHRVCRYCDTLLVEGTTCVSVVENQSRGGQKPWADVLRVTCTTCGRARRYPVSAARQPRRPARTSEVRDTKSETGELPKDDAAQQWATTEKQGKQMDTRHTPQHTVVLGRGKIKRPAGGSAENGPG
ncbi:hypothetical protein SEPCBS119000_003253 [Sporothrix epigloea]|uniref:Uncharacterized protein n=1 Tax=Sporothrix epigloea TaxID=1892477 RepID=A0ABP0DND7_9PEZI